MRKLSSTLTLFATLLLAAASGCSDEDGSSVKDLPDNTAGKNSSGGSNGTAGSTSPTAGTANQGGDNGTGTGMIPTEACMGLPIDLSGDAQGGAGQGG